ncbi:MAG: hypothetical protein GX456_10090 [Verrucomicrobia bacterium]|nr:hypothetical protein [Verrucomicrobiota bacterium]
MAKAEQRAENLESGKNFEQSHLTNHIPDVRGGSGGLCGRKSGLAKTSSFPDLLLIKKGLVQSMRLWQVSGRFCYFACTAGRFNRRSQRGFF